MSSKLFTMVDRGVNHITPLNTLVDNILHRIAPKMTASAVTCSGLRWAGTCYKKVAQHQSDVCSSGSTITYDKCTQWYYNNGKKFNSCGPGPTVCSNQPITKCEATCT